MVGVCVVGYKGYVCLDVGFLFWVDVRMYFRFILNFLEFELYQVV